MTKNFQRHINTIYSQQKNHNLTRLNEYFVFIVQPIVHKSGTNKIELLILILNNNYCATSEMQKHTKVYD